MCQAISVVSMPKQKVVKGVRKGVESTVVWYRDFEGRKGRSAWAADSHTSIARDAMEADPDMFPKKRRGMYPDDKVNKWEWNPWTGVLERDTVLTRLGDDRALVEGIMEGLSPTSVLGKRVKLKMQNWFGTPISVYVNTGVGRKVTWTYLDRGIVLSDGPWVEALLKRIKKTSPRGRGAIVYATPVKVRGKKGVRWGFKNVSKTL